jgi:hypothetical protein
MLPAEPDRGDDSQLFGQVGSNTSLPGLLDQSVHHVTSSLGRYDI